MIRRTVTAGTALALVVVLGSSVAVAAVLGSPELSAHFSDDRVVPGEQTSLELVLLNEGELEQGSARNPALNDAVTTARGLTVAVRSGSAPIDVVTGRQAIGTLPQGASQPIPFSAVVAEDAEPGTYDVTVVAEYAYTDYISEGDGTRDQTSTTDRIEVPITVEDGAEIDVRSVDSDARVGASETVALTVRNAGSMTAEDVRFTLSSTSDDVRVGGSGSGSAGSAAGSSAASASGSGVASGARSTGGAGAGASTAGSGAATRYAASWEPGENRTLRYQVTASDDAEPGEYGFTLRAEYRQPDGRQRSTGDAWVAVPTAPEQSFTMASVESNLAVGDDGRIRGRLVNDANRTVENVVLQWSGEQRNVSPTESEYAVGTLGPGEAANFSFDVEVSESARSGPRQFSFVARYGGGDARSASDEIDLRRQVAPAADEFDLAISGGTVSAGSSTGLDVTVTNVAGEPLSEVSGKLFAESPMSTTDSEVYVQSLAPGESANVTFGIAAGGGALEKTYPLSLDFRYEEPDGDTVTSNTYRVPVDVTRGGGGGPLTLVVGVLLVVSVLGVGAALRYT